jgi:hypothetical protein
MAGALSQPARAQRVNPGNILAKSKDATKEESMHCTHAPDAPCE